MIKMDQPSEVVISPHLKEWNQQSEQDARTYLNVEHGITVEIWIQPKWPETDEPIKKLPYPYTAEEYSAMKNNETLL